MKKSLTVGSFADLNPHLANSVVKTKNGLALKNRFVRSPFLEPSIIPAINDMYMRAERKFCDVSARVRQRGGYWTVEDALEQTLILTPASRIDHIGYMYDNGSLDTHDSLRLWAATWLNTDIVARDENKWRDEFNRIVTETCSRQVWEPAHEEMLVESEIRVLRGLPLNVTVYRGHDTRSLIGRRPLSWTLSVDVARRYARRGERSLIQATVPVTEVFAYFDRRGEDEVLLRSTQAGAASVLEVRVR